MSIAVSLSEYLENLRALLRANPTRWRVVVERQVTSQLLPRVAGTRAALEPDLWSLLVLCLDGHEADVPGLDDATWEKARQAAADGKGFASSEPAAYPRAAIEVAMVLVELREIGVYPPPTVRSE